MKRAIRVPIILTEQINNNRGNYYKCLCCQMHHCAKCLSLSLNRSVDPPLNTHIRLLKTHCIRVSDCSFFRLYAEERKILESLFAFDFVPHDSAWGFKLYLNIYVIFCLFCQKKSKHKGPVPVPRKSKMANGQSEAIGFSHRTPRHASNVCLTFNAQHTHGTLLQLLQ